VAKKKHPAVKKPAQSSHVARRGPQYGGNLGKNPSLPRDTGLIATPNEHTTVDGAGGAPGGQAAGDEELVDDGAGVVAIAPTNDVVAGDGLQYAGGSATFDETGRNRNGDVAGAPEPGAVMDPNDAFERDGADTSTSPTEDGPAKKPAMILLAVAVAVLVLLVVTKGK